MPTPSPSSRQPADLLTVVGIALVAYAASNVLHEAVGHGTACIAVGGTPVALSSVHFECGDDTMSTLGRRGLAAAGTIMNVIAGLVAFAILKITSPHDRPHRAYFLWLLGTINLLMAAGYFLFSGVGDIGDWAAVAHGTVPAWLWRPTMAAFGASVYFLLARKSARALRTLVGSDDLAMKRGRRIAIPAYFAGGLMYCVSGLFNPIGPIVIAISAAAASFGGTSGLLWLTALLRHFKGDSEPIVLERNFAWIAAGAISAVIFIAVLGPSIKF